MPELKARLERRAEDAPEVIAKRLAQRPRRDRERWREYDYVHRQRRSRPLLRRACKAILVAERLKRERLVGLRSSSKGLLAEKLD